MSDFPVTFESVDGGHGVPLSLATQYLRGLSATGRPFREIRAHRA